MSANTQSKRQKKIKKVMGEFKSGDLRSGGSGKKVTNPKQAIAIALAEANRMNQGGMMYEEIMNRPMFQTPQMRQGGGIMAGIAPIRGYAEGDLVSNEESGFFDTLSDMVVGDDGTLDDFFTTERTAEGQGLNLRDLTDFFLVDPNDPVDVGLASTSAALMMGGITAPGALAAQLGRLGYKGKKLFDVLNKAENLNKTKAVASVYGASQGGRLAGDVPEIVTTLGQAGDDIRELILSGDTESEEGPSFSRLIEKGDTLSQIARDNDTTVAALMAANPQIEDPDLIYAGRSINIPGSRKGIAALADEDVAEFADGGIASIHGYNLGGIVGGLIRRGSEASVDFVRNLMSRSKKGEDVTEEVADAVGEGKISPKEGEDILRSKADDVADDATAAADEVIIEGRGNQMSNLIPDLIKRNKAISGLLMTGAGVGGYGYFGPDVEPPRAPPPPPVADSGSQAQAGGDSQAQTGGDGNKDNTNKDNTNKDNTNATPATGIRRFLLGKDGKFGGDEEGQKGAIDFLRGAPADFLQSTISKLQDPSIQYALAKAAQPSEGIVPRNFLSDVALGVEEYKDKKAQRDYLQAQTREADKTDTERLVDYYVDSVSAKNPDLTSEDLASLRTGLNMSLARSQRSAADLASKLEILALIPDSQLTQDIFNKLSAGAVDQNLLDMIEGNVKASSP